MNSESKFFPLVTVITVVFNGQDIIEDTILSVINQSYKNIEYIVIDGGSTDNTVEVIERYKSNIHYWVSENDSGIYDAMNKGINAATGKWINFMNAGDTFSSQFSIEYVFSLDHSESTVIYGDVNVLYPNFKRSVRARLISEISKGMPFSHQSAFVKTSYHKVNKFNIENPIAADMELFMVAHLSGFSFIYLPFSISNISSGGVSDTARIRTIFAWWRVSRQLESSKYLPLNYMMLLSTTFLKSMVKRILPDILVLKFQKFIR